MKIGLVQFSPEWEKPEKNIDKIENLLNNFKIDCDMLVFPELTLTGFTMNVSEFAEDIDGTSTKYFMNLSRRLKTNVFAGIIENSEEGIYNSLVHFENNGLIAARYRKIHPYTKADEDKYYKSSNELVITKVEQTRIGLSICYDIRFPELYRFYSKSGIDIIINIANWPIPRIEHWRTLLKARAIENQAFVIGVNRVGDDHSNSYNGSSSIFDPMGNEIINAGNKEIIAVTEINLDAIRDVRSKLPFLKDIKLI